MEDLVSPNVCQDVVPEQNIWQLLLGGIYILAISLSAMKTSLWEMWTKGLQLLKLQMSSEDAAYIQKKSAKIVLPSSTAVVDVWQMHINSMALSTIHMMSDARWKENVLNAQS